MAAVDRPVDHRCLAAPLGSAAAGNRRWRCPGLLALVRGLFDGCPVQLLSDLADRAAWFWAGGRIRCGGDPGARHHRLQGRHVLGDPPADRAGDPGRDRRRARSGPASGCGLLALVLHRPVVRHILHRGDRVRAREGCLGGAGLDSDAGNRRRPGGGGAGEPQFDRAGLRLRRDGHQADPAPGTAAPCAQPTCRCVFVDSGGGLARRDLGSRRGRPGAGHYRTAVCSACPRSGSDGRRRLDLVDGSQRGHRREDAAARGTRRRGRDPGLGLAARHLAAVAAQHPA